MRIRFETATLPDIPGGKVLFIQGAHIVAFEESRIGGKDATAIYLDGGHCFHVKGNVFEINRKLQKRGGNYSG